MLDLDIPTHLDVLADAQGWRKESTPAALRRAEDALRRGMAEFPYALALGDELALGAGEAGTRRRGGRVGGRAGAAAGRGRGGDTLPARQAAQEAGGGAPGRPPVGGGRAAAGGERAAVRQGVREGVRVLPAGEPVGRAVRAGRGDPAGGRNDEARELLTRTRQDAAALLSDGRAWGLRLPDDSVWLPAAQGEANVLLGRWAEAEAAYARAVREAGGRKFYHDSMADQLAHLLLPAAEQLGDPPTGRLARPDEFFRLEA